MKTCSISGCSAHVKGHDLCAMHLMRLRRHGSTEVVMRPGPQPKAKPKPKNEALQIAKASNSELDGNQVRILRVLRGGRELNRDELTRNYNNEWLNSLWALANKRPPLIEIRNYEGDRKHYHRITAAGKAALKKAEAAAATILECASKR